jgi:phosphohistidine swiveling domain-containing protein
MKKGVLTVYEYRGRIDRLCAGNAYMSVPRSDGGSREWKPPVGTGVPINHGIAWGRLALTPARFEEFRKGRENIIYMAQTTKPSDFHLINNSQGIVTVYPGRTSHAAITSITLNKPCVVGCANAVISLERGTVTFKGEADVTLKEASWSPWTPTAATSIRAPCRCRTASSRPTISSRPSPAPCRRSRPPPRWSASWASASR